MLWVFLGLLAAVFWTLLHIIDKHAITYDLRDPVIAAIVSGICEFMLFIVVTGATTNIFVSSIAIIDSVIAGALYCVAFWMYYYSLRGQEVSRYIPVLSLIPVFVMVFSFVFLGERLSGLHLSGILLIVAGSILISYKKGSFRVKRNPALLLALLSVIFYALRNILIKNATYEASPFAALFWMGIGGLLVSLVLLYYHHPRITRRKAKVGVVLVALSGIFAMFAFLFFTMALSMGSASLTSALLETENFFIFAITLSLARLRPRFLKERFSRKDIMQKLLAIVVIFLGFLLIVS